MQDWTTVTQKQSSTGSSRSRLSDLTPQGILPSN
jgi:hypothetical protein